MIKQVNQSGAPRRETTITTDKLNTYPPSEGISSPKEAFRTADGAVLGASVMFKGFKIGILECCQAKRQCLSGFQGFPLLRMILASLL